MALQTSGPISLNNIHTEAGGGSGSQASINDSDIRNMIGKGSGAQASFSEYYGAASSFYTATATISGEGVYVAGNRHPQYGGSDPYYGFFDWVTWSSPAMDSQSGNMFSRMFVAQDPNVNEILCLEFQTENTNWTGATTMTATSSSGASVATSFFGNYGPNGLPYVLNQNDSITVLCSPLQPGSTYTQMLGTVVTVEIT